MDFKKQRFGKAPSANTFKPHLFNLDTALHMGSKRWSPVNDVVVNCAYGKHNLLNRPRTIMTSIEVASSHVSSPAMNCCSPINLLFMSPRLVKPNRVPFHLSNTKSSLMCTSSIVRITHSAQLLSFAASINWRSTPQRSQWWWM